MSYGSLTRWKCPLKEHLKRVAVAFLAAAMLLSACPVAGYAAALAMPQDLTPAAKAENKDTKTGDSAAKGAVRSFTLALAKEAGVVMTSAGATYPYGHDPLDSNIRVAPSLPPVEELQQAMEVFCCCLKLAALEQLK